MESCGQQDKVDWLALWRLIFPYTIFTHACWISHFGVDVSIVDYVWNTYHDDCALKHPLHLLLILHFLKVYPVEEVLAARFGLSKSSATRILWPGLERLALAMEEVQEKSNWI